MKTLTKREKILIYILLYVLIIACGGLILFLPALEKNTSLRDQYNTLETQWLTTKAGKIDYKDLDVKLDEANKEYDSVLGNFFKKNEILPEDIDKLITSMVVEHKLTPKSLKINEIVDEDIVEYNTSIISSNESQDEKDTNTNKAAKINVYYVDLTVEGSITNLQSLINDTNSSRTIKVSSVSYTNTTEKSSGMTISFKIYVI